MKGVKVNLMNFLPAKFDQRKNITPKSIFAIQKFFNVPYIKPLLGLKSDIHTRMHQEFVDRKNRVNSRRGR